MDFVPVPRRPGGAAPASSGGSGPCTGEDALGYWWCPLFLGAAFRPSLPAVAAWRGALPASRSIWLVLLPSLAGRGGEERRWFQDLLAAGSPASWGGAQCRDRWKSGGCGKMAPWPCALSVLQLRCLRRMAYAVVYMCGVVPFPGFAAAWRLLFRRRSATKDLLRRCGGSAATPFAAVVLGVLCLYCCVFRFCTRILC